ncbi:acyl carrier protein [Paenibacillus cellulosilyticus]|nr:acyl carrier protein [Paenibacillus cellulosilyticus]QKS44483.1 acyl carrier protein [Paenibacillus cellulosilyticus]
MNAIDEKVSRIVGKVLQHKHPIAMDQVLYPYGLDSMKIIELIVQLEDQFNILLDDNELYFENFSNKRDIIARVKRKLYGQPY